MFVKEKSIWSYNFLGSFPFLVEWTLWFSR